MKKAIVLTAMILSLIFSGCSNASGAAAESENFVPVDQAQVILDKMSLEEKIGQMFLIRYSDDQTALSDIAQYNPGGILLFAKDFENHTKESIKAQLDTCQQASGTSLIIGVDEEGGVVTRISRFTNFRSERFKSPQDLYAEGGFERIASDTDEKCALLKSIGINVNLAPVADVSEDPSSFIYDRTIGQNAEITSEYVRTVVGRMKANGMGSALKHFPGYGDNGDTHTDIITDARPLGAFVSGDLLPFQAGIDEGTDIVLVSHNIVSCMDPDYPASLSPTVHALLRNTIGFDGVIMTDDLVMSAITEYTDGKSAAVQAVIAGNDLLCCSDYAVQVPAVIEAVKSGVISEERINESAKRIIQMKLDLGIIQPEPAQ